jgi:hypothetical protein
VPRIGVACPEKQSCVFEHVVRKPDRRSTWSVSAGDRNVLGGPEDRDVSRSPANQSGIVGEPNHIWNRREETPGDRARDEATEVGPFEKQDGMEQKPSRRSPGGSVRMERKAQEDAGQDRVSHTTGPERREGGGDRRHRKSQKQRKGPSPARDDQRHEPERD